MNKAVTFALLSGLLSPMAWTQTPRDTIRATLDEVRISALHRNDSVMRAPASVVILTPATLGRNNHTDVAPIMNTVAGVLMQSSNLTTSRISIRGIGARTPYGTNKVRAFYGNIPLTSGNGETIIDDIDLESLGSIEIVKGPLSTLYGAGLGGALLLSPDIPQSDGQTVTVSAVHGSFGTNKNNIGYKAKGKHGALQAGYHRLQSDGWRDNSAYDRESTTLAGHIWRGNSGKLTYMGNYTRLTSYLPSSIDRTTFDQNPKAAASSWAAAKGYKKYESVLGGLGYDGTINDRWRYGTAVFANYKDNDEPRPFDILGQYTFGYGARAQLSGQVRIGTLASVVHVGLEYFGDAYAGRTIENLYRDNGGNGSLEGRWLTAQNQSRQWTNAFAQWRLPVENWELQAGCNLNQTRFDLEATFPEKRATTHRYEAIWSPQASLLYRSGGHRTFYLSASGGFSLPSIEETLTESGAINPDIKPETGLNLELGAKVYGWDQKFYAEVAAYRMDVRNLLVARRVAEDRYIGVNAGQTLHQGVEFLVRYHAEIGAIRILPYASGSFGDYRFEDFTDRGEDYSGNRITGVARQKYALGLRADCGRWYALADWLYVSDIPLNDGNTAFSDAYRTLNVKTGCDFRLRTSLKAGFHVGINNAANERYAALVLPNAMASGTSQPRYFYPGLPVNYYANVSFEYRL